MKVVVQETSLWFKEGSSDKVYNVVIEEVQGSGMYVVNFSYGRRGNSLQTGTKTNEPVSFSEAEKIFNKLVGEKTKKGYRISASNTSTSIQVIAPTEEVPVSKCVLLNPIDESQAEELINDDDWVMQEKMDGVRYMIEIKRDENFDPTVKAYNRTGREVPINEKITTAFARIIADVPEVILDGELVGEVFHVFDMPHMGADLRQKGYEERYILLTTFLNLYFMRSKNIKLVMAYGINEDTATHFKRGFYNSVKDSKEGVVFKMKGAKYYVGRPASGGDYLKYKFWQSCSCIVTKVNSKRSVSIGLMDRCIVTKVNKRSVTIDHGDVIGVGNVTIPANFDIPRVGAVVEVKYLYAFRGGSLFQPIYLGERFFEVNVDEIQSIKYKDGSED